MPCSSVLPDDVHLQLPLGAKAASISSECAVDVVQVSFEIADVTTCEVRDASYDVIYSRDTILHIQDKPALFRRHAFLAFSPAMATCCCFHLLPVHNPVDSWHWAIRNKLRTHGADIVVLTLNSKMTCLCCVEHLPFAIISSGSIASCVHSRPAGIASVPGLTW